MQGYQFNAITDHWRPYVYDIVPTDFTNTSFIADGLNMDVLKALQLKLNFTTHLSKGNGSWSNMIDLVNRKQFDFAAVGFSHVSWDKTDKKSTPYHCMPKFV